MLIRDELAEDADAIRDLVIEAFKTAAHSSGAEAAIIDVLRAAQALPLSLVADEGGALQGHVAFSPVTIDGQERDWFGLGPLAVRPARHRRGIGWKLVAAGLERLKAVGAQGCVVLGAPGYYGRFGFAAQPGLWLAEVPPAYFLALAFDGPIPQGEVRYHPAFAVGGASSA